MESVSEAFLLALRKVDAQQQSLEILSARVDGDEQGFRFVAEVEGKLDKPRARFRATLDGWAMVDLAGHTASAQPGLRSARITSLDIDGWSVASKPVAAAVNAVLGRYMDNVNGRIERLTYEIKPGEIGLSGEPIEVLVANGKTITVPGLSLGPAAMLVEKTGLHLVVELKVGDAPAHVERGRGDSYAAYQASFWAAVQRMGPPARSKAAGLYVSEELLTAVLSPAFRPVDLASLQQSALANVLDALQATGDVAAGAVVSAETLRSQTRRALDKVRPKHTDIEFGEPKIRLAEQSIVVEVPIGGVIRGARLGFKARLVAAGVLAPKDEKLYLRLAVAGLTIEDVHHLGGQIQLTPFVASVNGLVEQFIPYVNAALDGQAIAVQLPAVKPLPLPVGADGVRITPARLVVSPPNAISLIPRIDEAGLRLLVVELAGVASGTVKSGADLDLRGAQQLAEQLRAGAGTAAEAGEQLPEVTPAQVNAAFAERWARDLPSIPVPARGMDAAVSMRWVTSTVNRVLAENRLSASIDHDSQSVSFDSGRLRLAASLTAGCRANKQCSRGECKREVGACTRDRCDWSCQRCVRILGKRICSDDPACKASRAACDVREEARLAACNLREESRVAACKLKEEAEVAACNVTRNLEIAGCAMANQTIRTIREIDSIGRFSGGAKVKASASVSAPELGYEPTTGKLSLGVDVRASASITGTLHFVPADVGHVLVCPVPGSVPFRVAARLADHRIMVKAQVRELPTAASDPLKLELAFDAVAITGRLSPAPLDALVTQNPQVMLACSPALIAGLGAAKILGEVSAFGPADVLQAIERAVPGNQQGAVRMFKAFTTGVITERVAVPPMQVELPELTFWNGDERIALRPRWRAGYLLYEYRERSGARELSARDAHARAAGAR